MQRQSPIAIEDNGIHPIHPSLCHIFPMFAQQTDGLLHFYVLRTSQSSVISASISDNMLDSYALKTNICGSYRKICNFLNNTCVLIKSVTSMERKTWH